ncbi:hypothetical protein [Allobranchiibius sp. CTAmp26]|uniref:hypothetical protein n=1 Tax=Allobranchiibius sp. CTAmp26 TaxID=2815214 RepID=UPI001AA10CBB|nr:hypothetical protein [Allobranchiibius sp. CTAmp26]MBO1755940.1 hypothetical protein [Allobranchiibius sp. CTAmp26]
MHGTTWYVVVSVRHCPVFTAADTPDAVLLELLELLDGLELVDVLVLGADDPEDDVAADDVAFCTVGAPPPPPQAASITTAAATPTT